MRWVKKNIERFGGDKKRITVYGQSSGAASVALHLVIPSSKELFSKAIMESGAIASWAYGSLTRQEALSYQIVHALGCDAYKNDASRIDCMRRQPAISVHNSDFQGQFDTWVPTIDGSFLPQDPNLLLFAGQFHKVPIIIGTNQNDSNTVYGVLKNATSVFPYIEAYFGVTVSEAICQLYNTSTYATPYSAAEAIANDFIFVCPARRMAKAFADCGLPVYSYFYTYVLDAFKSNPFVGTFHQQEQIFLFNAPNGTNVDTIKHVTFTQAEKEFFLPLFQYYWYDKKKLVYI